MRGDRRVLDDGEIVGDKRVLSGRRVMGDKKSKRQHYESSGLWRSGGR